MQAKFFGKYTQPAVSETMTQGPCIYLRGMSSHIQLHIENFTKLMNETPY